MPLATNRADESRKMRRRCTVGLVGVDAAVGDVSWGVAFDQGWARAGPVHRSRGRAARARRRRHRTRPGRGCRAWGMNFEQEDSGEAGSSWVHSCARYEIEPSVTDSSGGNPVLPHGPGGSHREGESERCRANSVSVPGRSAARTCLGRHRPLHRRWRQGQRSPCKRGRWRASGPTRVRPVRTASRRRGRRPL